MTSRKVQVPAVLAAYRRLYGAARAHVRPGGALVAACCTSRIDRRTFHRVVRESLAPTTRWSASCPSSSTTRSDFPRRTT